MQELLHAALHDAPLHDTGVYDAEERHVFEQADVQVLEHPPHPFEPPFPPEFPPLGSSSGEHEANSDGNVNTPIIGNIVEVPLRKKSRREISSEVLDMINKIKIRYFPEL